MRACLSNQFVRILLFIYLSINIGWRGDAAANVGEAYGFGSRTAALAGAGAAWGADAFATYYNPAQLALPSDRPFQVGYGGIYMQPNFKPIQNVLTQNTFISDSVQTGTVDTTSYRPTFGQELGFSYQAFPQFANLTLGLVTFFPLDSFAVMDTGEAYEPEYVLYRARTQRPQVELGAGVRWGKGFYAGMGLHMAFALTSNASVFINTRTNTASSMRFTSSMKPKASPYFGLLYAPTQGEEGSAKFSLGAVFRLPVVSENTMVLNSSARVFGDFAAVDFNFTALSALFYDPMAIELGSSWQSSEWSRFYGQVEYQFWGAFQAPALLIQQPQTTNCKEQPSGNACPGGTLRISPGAVPNFTYVNILVPRVGWEFTPGGGKATWRVGYAYRRSFLSDSPSGPGNYLDPAKHMLNLGLGLNLAYFRLDFNLAYQALVSQHVTKTPGNEVGNLADSKIGSPGYDMGGSVYGGGASLSLAF